MMERVSDGVLRGLLEYPSTTQKVCATVLYDGQTGITLSVKFIGKRSVSALISRGEIVNYRIDKVRSEWVLPDAWKQKETIRDLLQFVENEDSGHDRENYAAQ